VAEENPTWGAPKIHGELQKFGLEVSERTEEARLTTVLVAPESLRMNT
jgi:hypothetical protein